MKIKTSDYFEEISEWETTKDLYTTEELLNWIRSYARQIEIITDIIEKRCKEEGFCIDVIKK